MALEVKNLPAYAGDLQETLIPSLGGEDPLEEKITTHFSILAWKIPWTEEPGGLQSKGLQWVRHDWATKHTHTVLRCGCADLHSHQQCGRVLFPPHPRVATFKFAWDSLAPLNHGPEVDPQAHPLSLLFSKCHCSPEIKPVHLKGNQPWIFTGRTDAEPEAPILWPPDAKS